MQRANCSGFIFCCFNYTIAIALLKHNSSFCQGSWCFVLTVIPIYKYGTTVCKRFTSNLLQVIKLNPLTENVWFYLSVMSTISFHTQLRKYMDFVTHAATTSSPAIGNQLWTR